jgi:hypothetical protein
MGHAGFHRSEKSRPFRIHNFKPGPVDIGFVTIEIPA